MLYTEYTLHLPHNATESLSNLLIAAGLGGFEVSDAADFNEFIETVTPHWDYVDESLLEKQTAPTFIRFYLPQNEQSLQTMADIRKRIAENTALSEVVTIESVTVDDSSWTDTWKQYYKPIEIGKKLAIVPEWEDYTPAEGQAVLRIDPGAAFGTGTHETTSLCLSMLHDMNLLGQSVLDVGCGSGILSVAALLLGAEKAVGVDIDELAVKASKENAERNGLGDKITYLCGDLTDKVTGCYHIVTANIVADVLLQLLPAIGDKMYTGGIILLSGILNERAEEIEAAAKTHHFKILQTQTKGGWSAIMAQKGE